MPQAMPMFQDWLLDFGLVMYGSMTIRVMIIYTS